MTSRSESPYRIPSAGRLEELGDARSCPGITQQVKSDPTQVIRAEGLGQEGVGATTIGSLASLLLSMCGEHQYLQIAGAGIASNPLQDFPAVHPRESDVEDQQGGRVLQCGFEAARSITASLNLYPSGAEAHADEPLDDHGVFHDENALSHDNPFFTNLFAQRVSTGSAETLRIKREASSASSSELRPVPRTSPVGGDSAPPKPHRTKVHTGP